MAYTYVRLQHINVVLNNNRLRRTHNNYYNRARIMFIIYDSYVTRVQVRLRYTLFEVPNKNQKVLI